eukprot:15146225-Alexandrium_andersonii.AAC.1
MVPGGRCCRLRTLAHSLHQGKGPGPRCGVGSCARAEDGTCAGRVAPATDRSRRGRRSGGARLESGCIGTP